MDFSAALSRNHPKTVQLLRPVLRAYALGYLSSTTPKILNSLRLIWKNNKISHKQKLEELSYALTGALRFDSFPTFCAVLVGGSITFPLLLLKAIEKACRTFGTDPNFLKSRGAVRLIRFAAAFISAWFSFRLLNQKPINLQRVYSGSKDEAGSEKGIDPSTNHPGRYTRPEFAGRTMDLTLFSVTRAADLIGCIIWTKWRDSRKSHTRRALADPIAPRIADSAIFAASAAIVMWAWFYLPERLPKSYGKWIGEVAKVDNRLIEALRRARRGTFIYGKDTGQAPLLESMCREYGWPIEWGDPAKTVPIPCEMVHMGCGPSCEKHAIFRFLRTFKFACATYIPLQIAFRLRSMKSMESLRRAIYDAARSSSFLAAFVSLFYYSVCLSRTRIGPKIFNNETVTPLMWDSGLCVGAGCVMCGWSILVEHARKRQEIALFVAPRAAATVLPRFYDIKYQYRERTAFAVSAAILLTSLQERSNMVRGVFGRIGRSILN